MIDELRSDIETLAHGRKLDGITECPKCGKSVSFRTNVKGEVYWFQCAGSACLRFYAPEKIRPGKKRQGIVYPNLRLNI